MTNNWKEIWNRHDAYLTGQENLESLVLELKKANGFDVVGDDAVSYSAWQKHIQTTADALGDSIHSLYEVGCGSGANLVLFHELGIEKVGGVDYSANLACVAAKVTGSDDIICGEGNAFPVEPAYDAVISDSVTQYLPSREYAMKMFERMIRKASRVVAILDVHDDEKKAAWLTHRRAVIPNHEEKYAGLDDTKLFFPKNVFVELAEKHGLRAVFCDTDIDNYWNGQYTYNVFLYK